MLDDTTGMVPLVWRRVKIPAGLAAILELISREVLREQPKCIYSFTAELLEKELNRKRPSKQPEQGDDAPAGRYETVNEDTRLLGDREDGSGTRSEAVVVVVKVEEDTEKDAGGRVESVITPTVIAGITQSLPALPKAPEAEVVATAKDSKNGGRSSGGGDTDIVIEDEEDEEEMIKNADAGLDTTEIEKIRQSGDFRNVSMTVEALDHEDAEEEEEEEDESGEEEEEDNNNGGENYEEDVEDSDFEEEDKQIKDIMDKHMEDSKSDNELNEAAIKIQAGFRGYKARKHLREGKDDSRGGSRTGTDDEHADVVAITISPLRTETEGEDGSGSERLSVARRRPGSQKIRDSAKYRSGMVFQDDTSDYDNDNPSSEEILGLDNEYLNKAATRIQANVRGWMTRKQFEKERNVAHDKKEAATKIQATVRGFLTRRRLARARNANRRYSARRRSSHGNSLVGSRRRSSLKPDVAATRIQAIFRGYHARKTKSKKRMSGDGGVIVGGGDAADVGEQD